MAYDRPRTKRFYGSAATSGLSAADCAVTVSTSNTGVIEARFKRGATLADPSDKLGANITAGKPTLIVWAYGDSESGFVMDYHGRRAGTTMVTW